MSGVKNIVNYAEKVVDDGKEFIDDSLKFLQRCSKPDRKGIFLFQIIN